VVASLVLDLQARASPYASDPITQSVSLFKEDLKELKILLFHSQQQEQRRRIDSSCDFCTLPHAGVLTGRAMSGRAFLPMNEQQKP